MLLAAVFIIVFITLKYCVFVVPEQEPFPFFTVVIVTQSKSAKPSDSRGGSEGPCCEAGAFAACELGAVGCDSPADLGTAGACGRFSDPGRF